MEGFKKCGKATYCEYGCYMHPGYCALGKDECPKEIEDFECFENEINKYNLGKNKKCSL